MNTKTVYDENMAMSGITTPSRFPVKRKAPRFNISDSDCSHGIDSGIGQASGNDNGRLLLETCPDMFGSLSAEELDFLSRHAALKSFRANSIVFHEQDDVNALVIVVEGKIKLTKSRDDGRELVLGTRSAGDYFGETALLDSGPGAANIIALERCRLAMINRKQVYQVLMSNPQFALNIIAILTKRLRQASRKITSFALMDVYERLASLFNELAVVRNGGRVVSEPLTKQEIANRIGCSREMVTRIMKDLVTGGYIVVQKRVVTIKKPLPKAW